MPDVIEPGAGTQVLIIGAGPAGLTLACELTRRGIHCLVAEKDQQPAAGSRGKGMQPRTQEIFEDLGILPEVRARGGLYPPLQARSGGTVVFEGRMDPLRAVTPDVPYPNLWMLPQWQTAGILHARLASLGGRVEFGSELESFRQDSGGVTAILRRGDSARQVRADYLVGADGGHSAVRRILGVGFAGQTRDHQRTIVADVQADGVSRDFWHVWTAAGNDQNGYQLGLCPLPGTAAFQLTAPIAAGDDAPELTLRALQRLADEAAGPGRLAFTSMTWCSLYRTSIRMAERFGVGRTFLAGDAAHVHSPAGGQGLNTSIQDAYNLGWKLAAVLRGAPAALLDSYEAERLPVAADVLGISTRLHDKAAGGEADAHRRDDPELRQLSLGYRDGPLSQEYRAAPGVVRAGDRAPDAPGRVAGNTARLFGLLHGGQTTLLAFGPAAAVLAAALVTERPGAPVRAVSVERVEGPPAVAPEVTARSTGSVPST
ncbi:MAG: FAD-dependent monooxygenase, partial [Streptosporangiaceae bacterium]